MAIKTFGKLPSGNRLEKIKLSPNYRNGAFQNIEPTDVLLQGTSYFTVINANLHKPASNIPPKEIPSINTDLLKIVSDKPTIVWFGHSSYFIQSKDFTILVDPVFSGHASPLPFFVKAFKGANVYSVDDLPAIDLLVLTHDHYDHLDFETILKLKGKVKNIITTLGVGSHLEYWGFEPTIITELDWWESKSIANEIEITATPARHFSGRGLKRAQTLWASFYLQLHGFKLFLGGDSGYSNQFKLIGEKFGPFGLAILENGQYGQYWPNIHMMPEETVQAAIDLKADVLLPVHWAKFALAIHPWNEPIKRLVVAANKAQIKITTPLIGEPFTIGETIKENVWWEF